VLYFSPETKEIPQGASFVSEVRLDTEGENINTIALEIFFPLNVLEIVDLNLGESIFSLYPTKPEYSNALGSLSLEAGIPGGFQGDGLVARIFFDTKSRGPAQLRFSDNSQVYLNDGFGTPASLERKTADYTVSELREGISLIYSITHPNENIWYANPVIDLRWDMKAGVFYSYVLSLDPGEIPDEFSDLPIGAVTFMPKEDGIFYFHLRECKSDGCGPSVTYRILKDTVAPEPFQVQLGQQADAFEGKRFLTFLVIDKTSGIDHYEIRKPDGQWLVTEIPYVLENDASIAVIEVKAVDKAGNERIVSFPLQTSTIGYQNYLSFGIIIGIGILILYIVFRRLRKYIFKA